MIRMVFLLDVLFCLTKAILFEVYFLYIELGIVLINLKFFLKCFPRWKGELGEKLMEFLVRDKRKKKSF